MISQSGGEGESQENCPIPPRIGEINPNKKVALITGVTGQDGSYLAEFLLEKGYEVLTRNAPLPRQTLVMGSFNIKRMPHI